MSSRNNINEKQKERIFLQYNGQCADCKKISRTPAAWIFTPERSKSKYFSTGGLDIHHINPVSNGGINNDENLILLCINCHKIRHGATPESIKHDDMYCLPYENYICKILTYHLEKESW